jgi:hypothetical protein
VLQKFSHVFARDYLDIGPGFRHPYPYRINTTTSSPQPKKYIGVAEAHKKALQEHIKKLEQQQVVQRVKNIDILTGNWVIVPKPNGKLRFCLDLRSVNNVTVDDKNFPVPAIPSILRELAGHRYYTSLDMVSAYHQFPIHENDWKHNSFLSPEGGTYVFKRCLFGGRLITSFLQSITTGVLARNEPNIRCYVDDITLFSDSLEEHFQLLNIFLDRLSDSNLVLNPEKSKFLRKKITIFGYEGGFRGYKPSSSRVKSLEKLETPKTWQALRRNVAGIAYFRPSQNKKRSKKATRSDNLNSSPVGPRGSD